MSETLAYIQELYQYVLGKPQASSVASSVYAVITAVISHLITHGSTDPLREYALNSTAVIYLLNNTYSVIRHKYARTATRDYT